MTVIDTVLATEKASTQKLEEAKAAAAETIHAAKNTQATKLEAEKARLREIESAELAAFEKVIAQKVKETHHSVEKKVAAIEEAFTSKKDVIAQKIKQSFT
jgi:hypothetical protein